MATVITVAELSEIPVGSMKVVTAKGHEALLANVDGEIYALSRRCVARVGKTRAEDLFKSGGGMLP